MQNTLRTKQFSLSSPQILGISLFSFCTAITLEIGSSIAATTAILNNWQFNPQTQQLEINLSVGKTPNYFYLAQPPRLVIDLPDTRLGRVATQQNYGGKIQKIRVSQLNANSTRIVLDLAPGTDLNPNQFQLQPISKQNPTRWVLRPINPNNSTAAPSLPQLQPFVTLPPATTNSQQPFVTVPPLTLNNPTQQPNSILPPAQIPSSPNNTQSVIVPSNSPNIPNSGNSPDNFPTIQVIEFGQPLPQSR
jgi:hypothetical protein